MGENSGYKHYVAGLVSGVSMVIVGHPFDTVKVLDEICDKAQREFLELRRIFEYDPDVMLLALEVGASIPKGQTSQGGSDVMLLGRLKKTDVRVTGGYGYEYIGLEVKLQKYNTEAHGFKYRNGLHCTTRILKTEGVRGLYRGATPSFVGMAFESSILFGIYSQTKQALQGDHNRKPEPRIIIPSAAFAGSIISFILCPSELVKCRMQIQGADSMVPSYRKYSSPLNCAIETVKSEGVAGLFKGGVTTLLRECIGNAVFFCTYEYLKHSMHLQVKNSSSNHTNLTDVGIGIVSGGLSGIAFWSAVLPLDVAKTIIQTTPDKNLSTNPFKLLKSIYRRSGIRGCYTGLGPTVSRAFPANAAAIVTFEAATKILGITRD